VCVRLQLTDRCTQPSCTFSLASRRHGNARRHVVGVRRRADVAVFLRRTAHYIPTTQPTRPTIRPLHNIVHPHHSTDRIDDCTEPAAKKGKGSPYSTAERRVTELIPVLGSQPANDVSHKPGGRLPLLSARPTVTPATLKRAATNFAAW